MVTELHTENVRQIQKNFLLGVFLSGSGDIALDAADRLELTCGVVVMSFGVDPRLSGFTDPPEYPHGGRLDASISGCTNSRE